MFRFKNFKIYNEAKDFAKFCEEVISKNLKNDRKELLFQTRGAYLSVILNIAEGSGCDSDKEFRRFLEISLRSVYEVVAAFDLAFEMGLVDGKIQETIESKAEMLCKQISSFRKKLNS
ncbi:hypothetical protein A2526_02235 [candidate division WOR-1 bacterium RIFOXYD2_FULL_36_8]|uniref:Four helix bundle protein n=1 Tax=candidate division WOR-1 bacterium RIFOXYB2_FULL_36_35 TaxID=1802578 RepID=A0A1F4RXB0_UNCSA|nr:MAG: hypothetical protein A2230_06315 [candidate division WOR-1 bacterium RIFOXYA2_FULL_36_21]OGC12787.1 MAG: hypothetical protein A2290_02045 [candidate division WOR-1 bacterium RIFOXYB2_FULL_36_35]OGC15206.1 MAG: hypothetical protein A2282_07605 [candidate division WOR-1 bacterium RIFOXYA12_FULL_36_13]OGC38346.1 MAG: hypothetical protein A2526_02235 [candidate division WOR-1 bacterium RIFOXYD2_FULL_36_8]